MDLQEENKKHLARIESYKKKVRSAYRKAIKEIAFIMQSVGYNGSKPFRFEDYPVAKKQVDKILEKFSKDMNVSIVNGVRSEWTYANNKNNEIFRLLFEKQMSEEAIAYNALRSAENIGALEAFIARTTYGLTLSERVWRISNSFKKELELALSVGIKEGTSAETLSRKVRQYLNEPDRLFRRVRDKFGNLVLSQGALNYHPGRGVYRSSYKNAMRLTATETNIAYRTSDYNRWSKEDFVLGIEIRLSNNHTLNGKPFHDMCDELEGKYPKDFKWVGWHPFCRCHAIPILDRDSLFEDLFNEDYKRKGVVTDVPDNFKKFMDENGERYMGYKNIPFFIADNPQYIEGLV